MNPVFKQTSGSMFVSYSSRDRQQVVGVANRLRDAGINCWRDSDDIQGGENYGPVIAKAIRDSSLILLMCSDASMRSKNVKQEIQLAWKYDVPYLPLLLEDVSYPEQIEYWLEGSQWVDVYSTPISTWLPKVMTAIDCIKKKSSMDTKRRPVEQYASKWSDLWTLARYTDQVWPVPADKVDQKATRGTTRGLGAAQPSVEHGYQLGSRVRLVVELETEGHLLLLDRGPEEILYCLCPSHFAPLADLQPGRWIFPQPESPMDAFVVTGRPGREELMAIVTEQPLSLNWMTANAQGEPAKILTASNIESLLTELRDLSPETWAVYSSYFDVIS